MGITIIKKGKEWWGGVVGPEERLALMEIEGTLTHEGGRAKELGELGPFSRYLSKGGELPVVLLTYNRAELLDKTLHSLLQVQVGGKKLSCNNIYVVRMNSICEGKDKMDCG
jgi:hypothetical protein